uniref:Transposase n=1 Tax=Steinernema glaseri TaxID=37863 RepID=A0A1I8ADA5_9BILA
MCDRVERCCGYSEPTLRIFFIIAGLLEKSYQIEHPVNFAPVLTRHPYFVSYDLACVNATIVSVNTAIMH